MTETLDRTQRRIIGVLIEKQLATPDQYPLTLNALQLGCNQKTSREPVLSLENFEVEGALRSLQLEGWVIQRTGGRATRWGHRAHEKLALEKPDLALMAVLMLRGAQTTSELKARTERLHAFTGLDAIEAHLRALAERPAPLVRRLGRSPGERAERWEHLLTPEDEAPAVPERATVFESQPAARPATFQTSGDPELETRVEQLEGEVDDLKEQLRTLQIRVEELESR
ncbi:MAG: YceH family protein [Planctomycetota bacterium]